MSRYPSREKIIKASVQLFSEKGYRQTTTKMIAEKAEVNEVTIFRHFGSKEEIVREIVHSRMSYLHGIQVYIEKEAVYDLEQDLMEIAIKYCNALSKNIGLFMILLHETDPDEKGQFSLIPREFKRTLINYFDRMQQQEKMIAVDSETAAVSFIATHFGYNLIQHYFSKNVTELPFNTYIKQSIQIFSRGMKP